MSGAAGTAVAAMAACAVWLLGSAAGHPSLGAVAGVVIGTAGGALSVRTALRHRVDDGVARFADALRAGRAAPTGLDGLDTALALALDRDGERRAALARQEAALAAARQVLDTSPLAIVTFDEELRITWVNETFRRMLRPRAEPVGRRPLEVLSLVELHEVVEEVVERRVPVERAATTSSLDLLLRGMILPSGAVVVRVEDVTTAREVERSRTDFVANVSHELRTPVASILGYLDLALAEGDRVPADVVPLLEIALRNGRRLRDLFEDLLKLHRIEARRRELPVARTLLAPLVRAAVDPARDKASMRGQTLSVEVPDDLAARVNPEALGQILSNLASNASSYSPEGSAIRVVGVPEGTGARLDVIDRGIGIAERHHERIFERFYRVDEARSRTVGGTGLGLAIVKHYAKASGCHVTLRSKEGEGSTFSVHLPG